MNPRRAVPVFSLLALLCVTAETRAPAQEIDVPKFSVRVPIDLARVDRISRFRSSQGHDFSDGVESCRSMKHYFSAPPAGTVIHAPAAGTVVSIFAEQNGLGEQIWLRPDAQPSYTVLLFHLVRSAGIAPGARVEAGQPVGRHASELTGSDVAVSTTDGLGRKRFVSFFDTLRAEGFDALRARGLTDIGVLKIVREERDARPLSCSGESFVGVDPVTPQWVDLLSVATPDALPAARRGRAFAVTLAGRGGTKPYDWFLESGALPPGLALDRRTGRLGGNPSETGEFSFVVRVVDAFGAAVSKAVGLTVSETGGGSPDLVVRSYHTASQAVAGAVLTVNAVVGNVGTAGTGAFRVSFRLSDALSLPFSCRADSGLAPGESFVCTGDAALPVGVSAGGYVTRAVVDGDGEVDESNEENNFRYADGGSTVLSVFAAAAPVSTTLLVPVVVSSAGLNDSFFTSELTVTNRGPRPATLTFSYTASIGSGSGSATDELPAGRQRVIPDALAYLRSRGVPLPDTGNLGGTLAIRFDGLADPADAGAIVRTATAVAEGRAGLAYAGMRREDLATDRVVVCGLRQSDTDRSNLALQHAGGPGSGEIVLEVTLTDGLTGAARSLAPVTLAPGGFRQLTGVLGLADPPVAEGWARVVRTSGSAPFHAYGVVNDQFNSDGSFVPAVPPATLVGRPGLLLPAVVETSAFRTEVVVANASTEKRVLRLDYRAEAVGTPDQFASLSLELLPGTQRIIPDFVGELRARGVPGIGPPGPTFSGALLVRSEAADARDLHVTARISTPGGGGRYGLAFPALPMTRGFGTHARVDGLRQDDENRSNLAIVNTGEVDGGDDTFAVDLFDGETGVKAETRTVVVPAFGFHQIGRVLLSSGVRQGWAEIRRVGGGNPFLAYGVVNDGRAPGERSGDGAFVPAVP